jgi:2-oxoglutarate ferredoxin oxidoreductase subunit alpha
MSQNKRLLLQGNEACVMGALRAGMTFFAGYPITPSSEIAEISSIELPKVGGRFIQMEDEIASMAAVIGASLTGQKAMTATSGPGFSLKQENIGYAAIAEVPCVIASIMRMGPSTGLPTSPAQGDIMQARWGTHGDHPAICICPTSVAEMYELTITAFNYAEKYRTPVILSTDEVIAHMREGVEIKDDYEIVNRKQPAPGDTSYQPYADVDGDGVPPLAPFGAGYRYHVTGLAHGDDGFPVGPGAKNDIMLRRICAKVEDHADEIAIYETQFTEDAELLFVAAGSVARAAMAVVKRLRAEGVKAGLFIPKTLWPFPATAYKACLENVKQVIVPELNLGQMVLEVERITGGKCPVSHVGKVTGELFSTEEIYDFAMAVNK